MLGRRSLKVGVSVLCTLPAIDIVRTLYLHNSNFIRAYDYDALMFALNESGGWAFVFLFLALACTPVHRIVRMSWILAVRRNIGVAAFGYCVLHFLAYFVVGQKLNVKYVFEDAQLEASRLLPGWAALLLLAPLAITSTNGMERRLGFKRWKLLHRLVYPAAALAIWHVYMIDKIHENYDYGPTKKVVLPFVILMAARFIRFGRKPAPS